MRIYHDFRPDELELSVLCDAYCYHDNVDLCNVNQMVDIVEGLRKMKAVLPFTENNLMDLNPVKWRYLPLLDPYVDRFIARDLDAEIIPREKSAVDQWLQSNRTFHVMRDHQRHGDPIMGGEQYYHVLLWANLASHCHLQECLEPKSTSEET